MTAKGKNRKHNGTVANCTKSLLDNRRFDFSIKDRKNRPGMSNAACSAANPKSAFLTPESGMEKNRDSGSGINFSDKYFGKLSINFLG
jgi:hypothetical protein